MRLKKLREHSRNLQQQVEDQLDTDRRASDDDAAKVDSAAEDEARDRIEGAKATKVKVVQDRIDREIERAKKKKLHPSVSGTAPSETVDQTPPSSSSSATDDSDHDHSSESSIESSSSFVIIGVLGFFVVSATV